MEKLYLDYLQLYISRADRDHAVFRSFVDGWHGYKSGPPFLRKTGRLRWFNNPNPIHAQSLRNGNVAVSRSAELALDQGQPTRFVVDHAIPLKIIRNELLKITSVTPSKIEAALERLYRLVLLTEDENSQLNTRYRSSMPENWDGRNCYARYEAAGIEIVAVTNAPLAAPENPG